MTGQQDTESKPESKLIKPAQSCAKARQQKLKVWEKDEPAEAVEEEDDEGAEGEGAANGSGAAAASGGSRERLEVVVSDVTDANAIYIQV